MKPQFIIIAALIVLKVIGVTNRANAASYLPGYTCDNSTTFQINCGESYYKNDKFNFIDLTCNTNNQLKFITEYTNPTYRCGQTPNFKRI